MTTGLFIERTGHINTAGVINKDLDMTLQEPQLSQRDRAMLHIIEYFSKPLTLTQGNSK